MTDDADAGCCSRKVFSITFLVILIATIICIAMWVNKNPDGLSSEWVWDDTETCLPSADPSPQPPKAKCPNCLKKATNMALQCQQKTMRKRPPSQLPPMSNAYSLPNLASYYLGGSAYVTNNTKAYKPLSSTCHSHLCIQPPNVVLLPEILILGKNFKFQGSRGTLVITLSEPAYITGFTVIHPLKCEMPNGYVSSAPKHFTVTGYSTRSKCSTKAEFGRHMYSMGGPKAQTFPVPQQRSESGKYQYLEFDFESNYGNPNYTTIYKLEVHGVVNCPNDSCENGCSECR